MRRLSLAFGLPFWLLLAGGLLMPGAAQANVVCNAQGTTNINFGSVTVNGPGGASATATVGYTCKNYDSTAVSIYLCVQGGNSVSYPGTTAQPQMQGGTPALNYNIYTSATHTTSLEPTNVVTTTTPLTIPAGNGAQPTNPPTLTLYGFFPGNQTSPAGDYTGSLYNNTFGFATAANSTSCSAKLTAGGHDYSGQSGITITATATVINACTVSGTNINLGSVAPTSTNLSATGTLSVNCPTGTTYNLGLLPSNGSTVGAGVMSGTGSNGNKVPYQLRSTTGMSGTVWGDTATSTSKGNGVAGTGNGSTQSIPVYVTAPGANYAPDTYTDTVTVNVYY